MKSYDDDLSSSIEGDDTTGRDLVENMRNNLIKGKSKDGINSGLFPLSSKSQADYQFHLIGSEQQNRREVFHIASQPKDKDNFSWKGDAYIDTTAYQPVVVRTPCLARFPLPSAPCSAPACLG